MKNIPAKLVLEDGSEFHGMSFGAEISTAGEVVFNTGMVGYPETLTDPSYKGQILIFTYPLVGNYGVPPDSHDAYAIHKYFESDKIKVQGVIVSEYSENYNHWNATRSLSEWLKENRIPGVTGIDTRTLTQKIREKGVMLGKLIVSNMEKKGFFSTPSPSFTDLDFYDPNVNNVVAEVSIKEPIVYKVGRKKVLMIDCGTKNNIIREFLARNITIIRVPWNFDIFTSKYRFDGVFIGNGPGDPAILKETHELVKICLKKKIPTFAICLGSQIMGIAAGAKTYKLKYGHRGQNQPVINLETKKCFITSQNHGFAVDPATLPQDWHVWMINANDNSVEGIKHNKLPFFSVQFHPEASPGPTDMNSLFDTFIKLL